MNTAVTVCPICGYAIAPPGIPLSSSPAARAAIDAARGWLGGTVTTDECRKAAAAAAAAYAYAERRAQAAIIRRYVPEAPEVKP